MRIYKLTYPAAAGGDITSWHPSEAAARTARAEVKRTQAVGLIDFRIKPVNIPTTKAGLIDWLNANKVQ